MGGLSVMEVGAMPKERVYDIVGLYDTTVAWDDTSVQVGIETHDGRPLIEHLGAGNTPEELAKFRGLWGTYDRDSLNRLIRALQRARNYRFGADA